MVRMEAKGSGHGGDMVATCGGMVGCWSGSVVKCDDERCERQHGRTSWRRWRRGGERCGGNIAVGWGDQREKLINTILPKCSLRSHCRFFPLLVLLLALAGAAVYSGQIDFKFVRNESTLHITFRKHGAHSPILGCSLTQISFSYGCSLPQNKSPPVSRRCCSQATVFLLLSLDLLFFCFPL